MTLKRKTLKIYLICSVCMLIGEIIMSFFYCSSKADFLAAFSLFFALTAVSFLILFFLLKRSVMDRVALLADYVEKLQTTQQSCQPIQMSGRDEIARLANGINKILSELFKMNRRQQESALRDGLTGMLNRSAFERALQGYQSGGRGPLGVAVIDLDGLKLFNDAFGHAQGDTLIQKIVSVLLAHVSEWDTIYRIGGDEFVVFLPIESQKKMVEWTKELQAHFAEMAFDNVFSYSASAGCAWSEKSNEVKRLVKEADTRMYEEKLSRRYKRKNAVVGELKNAVEAKIGSENPCSAELKTLAISLAEQENALYDPTKNMRLLTEFYDIGKIGIPDCILNKKGKLDELEKNIVKKHSEIGWRIAQSIPALQPISGLILHHHEWWNGRGYPLGLAGEEIPLPCRIIAIIDAYDEMIGTRFGMQREEAVALLRQRAGTQFDPRLVEHFIQQLEEKAELRHF